MMLQLGDDGVVTSVNEEELAYVDKNELEQLLEGYQQLEKENEDLKSFKDNVEKVLQEEYNEYSSKVWGTWIKNLSYKLKVILNE